MAAGEVLEKKELQNSIYVMEKTEKLKRERDT